MEQEVAVWFRRKQYRVPLADFFALRLLGLLRRVGFDDREQEWQPAVALDTYGPETNPARLQVAEVLGAPIND